MSIVNAPIREPMQSNNAAWVNWCNSVAAQINNPTSITVNGHYIGYAAASPTSGTWKVGDRVYNSVPAVGQPKSWVCTVAGTPGTWVSEGNL
jgi:hypothetical protein